MTYPGGKNGAGTYQKIINLMPPHARYTEPFLGGGAIMRLKRPATMNIGLDLMGSHFSAVRSELVKNGVAAARIAISDRPTPETAGLEYLLFQRCAIDYLESTCFSASDLVYCDPPYLMETRRSGKVYEYEMSTVDHRRFLRAAIALPCMVMISGYWSSLYAEALAGWNTIHFESRTRGATATEWVWFNFAPPTELHDYRYLGTGFRERERISRKKKRWTERLQRMPALERQALLAAIADIASSGDTRSRLGAAGLESPSAARAR